MLGNAIPKFIPNHSLEEGRKHQVPQTWVIKPKMNGKRGNLMGEWGQIADALEGHKKAPISVLFPTK